MQVASTCWGAPVISVQTGLAAFAYGRWMLASCTASQQLAASSTVQIWTFWAKPEPHGLSAELSLYRRQMAGVSKQQQNSIPDRPQICCTAAVARRGADGLVCVDAWASVHCHQREGAALPLRAAPSSQQCLAQNRRLVSSACTASGCNRTMPLASRTASAPDAAPLASAAETCCCAALCLAPSNSCCRHDA